LKAELCGERLPDFLALFRFLVEQLCLRSGTPKAGESFYNNNRLVSTSPDFSLVADPNNVTGPCASAVQLHLPAIDRFSGETSGFKEAGRPEPLVDSDLLC